MLAKITAIVTRNNIAKSPSQQLMFDINGYHSPAAAATTVRANDRKAQTHPRAATIKANGNSIRHEKARRGDFFAETFIHKRG